VAERVAYLAEAQRRAAQRDDEPDAQQARGG